ncbi:hypothetical protein FHX09_003136 [Rhizobium sp. BK538]|nr:hypothetical protein [Rhizobium sp. BK538]
MDCWRFISVQGDLSICSVAVAAKTRPPRAMTSSISLGRWHGREGKGGRVRITLTVPPPVCRSLVCLPAVEHPGDARASRPARLRGPAGPRCPATALPSSTAVAALSGAGQRLQPGFRTAVAGRDGRDLKRRFEDEQQANPATIRSLQPHQRRNQVSAGVVVALDAADLS